MKEELPQRIGIYKVESLLNKGGMSLLYLGLHPETLEPLAIKVLRSKYVTNKDLLDRFMKEAEIVEITDHPNIVKIYGHGTWEGGVYIAMEFIQGISLRQMILQEAMSLKRALEIVLQIGHALTHLHVHGIIHRDLKPENILLTAQGGVKVIDFGISQIYTESESQSNMHMLGSPTYMSPEQRKNPLSVGFSTDIYSLGVVTYELILGKLSYGVIHLSNVPMGLQPILSKALQPDPKDRYEDIVDFITDIKKYVTSGAIYRDMRGSDYMGEMTEKLREAQFSLISKSLPQWPRVDMAMASNCSTAISSLYNDFFQQSDGVYSLVMGESLTTGVEGLLQVAILKGMIRALGSSIEKPTLFVNKLNESILAEGLTFSFSVLTLLPNEDRFSYISCGYAPLWFIPAGSNEPKHLISNNIALGMSSLSEFTEVESNWHVGDTLLLHAFQAGRANNMERVESNEKSFEEALMANLFLSPKKQVDAIFRRVSQNEGRSFFSSPVTIIGIERTT